MKTHKLLLLALTCTWAMGAAAQWQWIDKDGRKVFSDRPPPQDIPDSKILKQPRFTSTVPAAAASAASAAAPAAAASTPAAAGKDKELEKKKAQAEADDAAKKKAEEGKQKAARAENCNRAKQSKTAFESGKPMRMPNAQGEMEFLDEAGRATEMKRIQSIIDADCKP